MKKYEKPLGSIVAMSNEDFILTGSVSIGISDDPASQPQRVQAFSDNDWEENGE